MRSLLMFVYVVLLLSIVTPAQERKSGIRGDSLAVAEAEAMVETMGGKAIWSQLKSLHFVHQWFPCYRVDTYIENEILDLTAPRSRADRKSEINYSIRAYSPEGKYWTINNGVFEYGSDEVFKDAMKRAPFNFYHLVRAVAVGDSYYEVLLGEGDIPNTNRLEFYGPEGVMLGWVILNAKKEPIVKATTQYRYTLGPLKQYGNLRIPAWGVYDNGLTRYEMISVTGSNQPLDSTLFLPPAEYRNK